MILVLGGVLRAGDRLLRFNLKYWSYPSEKNEGGREYRTNYIAISAEP